MRRILVALLTLAALAAPVSAQADYTISAGNAAKINFGDRWANFYMNNPASTYATSLIRYVSTYIQTASTCTGNYTVARNTGNTAWECRLIYGAMVGDSGAGGTMGLVPAPAAGDAFAGKYLKADGTWAAPASGGLATSTSVTTATVIGAVSVARVALGTSTGTVAITGSSKRTGDLKVEITTAGEADGGVCKWKYQFESEALSAEADCTAAPIAIGTTGLSASFTNGAPLSFEDGDVFSSAITWETSLNGFDCGLITVPAMNTPGTTPTVETVYVHWDATRIADATVPVISSVHSAAAGMFLTDTKATAAGEARFGVVNFSGSDWTDETGIVTLCRP